MAGLPHLFLLATTCSMLVEAMIGGIGETDSLGLNGPFDDDGGAVHDGQFLIISSPDEKKVVWTALKNFKSYDGRAWPLVSSGLETPKGLAFDKQRGHLYVADRGAKKIFRYTVLADTSGEKPVLTTSGVRLTMVEDKEVEWITIDHEGNLFYTAPDTNNINKIEFSLLRQIAKGEVSAAELKIVSQKKIMAEAKAKKLREEAMRKANNISDLPTDAPPAKPNILSIYESKINPQVSKPACVVAKGDKLYWTNSADGLTAGTVVRGKIHPENDVIEGNASNATNFPIEAGPKPFKAEALTQVSSAALGLAVSEKVIFFSQLNEAAGNQSGKVSGLLLGTEGGSPIILDFVTTLVHPRGLAFDGDQTMYVADESGGNVWSFPTGRMMKDPPLTRAVQMKGAFGLALLSDQDPCFRRNEVDSDGKMRDIQEVSSNIAHGGGQFLEKSGARCACALTFLAWTLSFVTATASMV